MKTWCDHITWEEDCYDGKHYWALKYKQDSHVQVPKNWKVCPVCLCERPTRENIQAAILRALMDGDQ